MESLVFSVLKSMDSETILRDIAFAIGDFIASPVPADQTLWCGAATIMYEISGGYLAVMRDPDREDRDETGRRGYLYTTIPSMGKYSLNGFYILQGGDEKKRVELCSGTYAGRETLHVFGEEEAVKGLVASIVKNLQAAKRGDYGTIKDLAMILKRWNLP